ncbi:efflux RND transporter permease subunit [Patescibacteria group bacterium]
MNNAQGTKPKGFARWTRFFIDKYRISILIIIAIVVAGIMGVQDIPKQDFPDVPSNMMLVTAVYPGASSSDIEQEVIVPLENKLSELESISTMRSNAANNFGTIFVEFEDFQQLDNRVAEAGDLAKEVALPSDAEVNVEQIDVTGPIVAYAMASEEKSIEELLELTPAVVTYLESSSDEIREVMVLPEAELQVEITLDSKKLAKAQLTKDTVVEAVKAATTTLPGGFISTEDGLEKPIAINSTVTSLTDVRNIAIGSIELDDIADIKRVPADDESYTIAGYINDDGEAKSVESVYLMVSKKGDGDVLRVSDAVAAAVGEIHEEGIVPEDVTLEKAFDTSPYVRNMIRDLTENGLLGLVVILIVLLLFVNLRAGLVVALIIPLVFLITWFILPLIGYTLSILTLFAMILALGILVDNAIVIAEGTMANLERGMKKRFAALKAVKDFGPAIATATVTTILVLIPYAMMGGIMGEFFKYIPVTLIIMLVASFLLAISITPLFAKWLLRETTAEEKRKRKLKNWQKVLLFPALVFYAQRAIDCIVIRYRSMMQKLLAKKKWIALTVTLTIILLAVSFGYFLPKLEFTQFPENDGEQLAVSVEFPVGTPYEEKRDIYSQIGDEILTIPYFETFFFFEGQFMVFVTEPADRDDDVTVNDIVSDLDGKLEDLRTDDLLIVANSQSYGPPSQDFDVIVEFTSTDSDASEKAVDDLEDFVKDKEHIDQISNGPRDLLVPAVEVEFDEDELARLAGSPMLSSVIINSVFSETDAGKVVIREDEVSDKVIVVFDEDAQSSVEDLEDVLIASPIGGQPFKLSDVADVKEKEKLESISRLDGQRVSAFKVKMTEDGDAAVLEQEIEDYLTADKLDEFGLEPTDALYGGEFAAMMETSSNLQIVFLIAVILVYIVLVYQFNSYGQPFFILFTVPLAMIGVFPGLYLVDSTLDMVSGLGVIALVGIVVNDAIVFIDYFNRTRRENPRMPLSQALVTTGQARFKPIFTTSITTIGGILPLTLNDPFWTGLGTSIISGLVFSTIGTLIVVPTVIYMFSRKPNKGKEWIKVKDDQDVANGVRQSNFVSGEKFAKLK